MKKKIDLAELFSDIEYELLSGDSSVQISGINIDSRLVEAGDLFVAVPGREADGHDYIDAALEKGAVAILISEPEKYKGKDSSIPVMSVSDTRSILSEIVNRLYDYPSKKFNLIGITGTNGKTSVATIIDHMLRSLGQKTGLIGTIENYCNGEVIESRRTTPTTPDCVELGEIMNDMADEKIDSLIMEVSSMGMTTSRVKACDFNIGVFTNVSPEHLDDHGTMDDYKEAKRSFFDIVSVAVLNSDDSFSKEIADSIDSKTYFYGIHNTDGCDIYAENIEYSIDGVTFDVVYNGKRTRISNAIPSEFSIYNILASIMSCVIIGFDYEKVIEAAREKIDIRGRYEVIKSEDGVSVIVDYAHTAAAMENLLEAVKNSKAYTEIISVFGCGGDRDPSKRPEMGKVSARLADYSVITSDNPRTEDPDKIIDMIEAGIADMDIAYEICADREKAINIAIMRATPGSVVVILGKGHEDYQILGKEKIHFDDVEIAKEVLSRRNINE